MYVDLLLFGEQIFLRCLRKHDASEKYLRWLGDSEITKFLEVRFGPPKSITELKDTIQNVYDSNDSYLFGIFLKEGNHHIGNIKLGPINHHHHYAELGFIIGDRNEWGKGYATAAIQLVTNFSFNELGIQKLSAGCYESNIGSQIALKKSGFVEEGREVFKYAFSGYREDGLRFGKFNPFLSKI